MSWCLRSSQGRQLKNDAVFRAGGSPTHGLVSSFRHAQGPSGSRQRLEAPTASHTLRAVDEAHSPPPPQLSSCLSHHIIAFICTRLAPSSLCRLWTMQRHCPALSVVLLAFLPSLPLYPHPACSLLSMQAADDAAAMSELDGSMQQLEEELGSVAKAAGGGSS